jgi:hydrogenase maturation protease
MNTLLATEPTTLPPVIDLSATQLLQRPVTVVILACGSADRGDDRAPMVAVAALAAGLPPDVEVRFIGRLDIDGLLAVPAGAGVVVVDTVIGVDPGWVVQIPFGGLIGRESGMVLRSSHALSVPGTVGLASMIHGRPMVGVVVAIGGVSFGLGDAISWPVAAGMATFRLAIIDAIDRVRPQIATLQPARRGSGPNLR